MLTLDEFLQSSDARRASSEAVGQTLDGLGCVLTDGRLGGTQVAYDATVLPAGGKLLTLARRLINGSTAADDTSLLAAVDELRQLAIRTRMAARPAVKFGLAGETTVVGSALVWLTPLGTPNTKEIALVVCCAGLKDLLSEALAEEMAGAIKRAITWQLAEQNRELQRSAASTPAPFDGTRRMTIAA